MGKEKNTVAGNNPDLKELVYTFENEPLFRALCGVADSGIVKLEVLLEVQLIPRGLSFLVRAEQEEHLDFAKRFFNKLIQRFKNNPAYFREIYDSENLLRLLKSELMEDQEKIGEGTVLDSGADPLKEKILTNFQGKSIFPRTHRQAEYIESILSHPVTFCLGPAGTGKTFLAIAAACRLLQNGQVERIILTRPAVEAGESLGFLPGDLNQKVDPYLRPVYDALYYCLGLEKVNDHINSRLIEIAPLAYMRGRTLNNSAIILDEAQNCTLSQLKMFLTRLGKNSHMCLGGDVTQIDLPPSRSGLVRAVNILRNVKNIGITEFTIKDIIRNPLVEKIVEAFELVEKEEKEDRERGRKN